MPNKICPRCNQSRETYSIVEKDLKKKSKSWKIERCKSCAFNFDIEEVVPPIEVPKAEEIKSEDGIKKGEDGPERYTWKPFYRF